MGATAHGFKNGARVLVLGEELGPSLVLVKRVRNVFVHGSKRLASAHCVDAVVSLLETNDHLSNSRAISVHNSLVHPPASMRSLAAAAARVAIGVAATAWSLLHMRMEVCSALLGLVQYICSEGPGVLVYRAALIRATYREWALERVGGWCVWRVRIAR